MKRGVSVTWRRGRDLIFWGLCALALALITAPAVSVLISVFHQAMPVLHLSLLTHRTNAGGISNAILGTLLLLLGVFVVAGTIGVGGGIYLAEFGTGRVTAALRFASEVLAGTPSIILGYVGYIVLVVQFHWGFSLLAAVLALSALVLPYIVKTTEVALRQIPSSLREATAGLGMNQTNAVWRVLVPPAIPGIVSGLIVALAISTGELAPLLFTAGFTDANPTFALFHHQVPYLTSVTYTDLSLPGATAHATSAAAGLVSLALLVGLIAVGRLVSVRSRRATQQMTL